MLGGVRLAEMAGGGGYPGFFAARVMPPNAEKIKKAPETGALEKQLTKVIIVV